MKGLLFDEDGRLASEGKVCDELLIELRQLEFYKTPPPKSLGYEWFDERFLPVWNKFSQGLSVEDQLRTAVQHVAETIAHELNTVRGEVLFTGGGAFNSFLMKTMAELMPQNTIAVANKNLIAFKEAMLFAFLGLLKWNGEVNVFSVITGASEDHSAGTIVLPSGQS